MQVVWICIPRLWDPIKQSYKYKEVECLLKGKTHDFCPLPVSSFLQQRISVVSSQ